MHNQEKTYDLIVAIMSDLHAFDKEHDYPAPSHLRVGSPDDTPSRHPITGLQHLINQESLKADLLLCPGDLGDKAEPSAIAYAWKAVNDIGNALGVSCVAATSGNHDVDSRHVYNQHDAKGYLQTLTPTYPLCDEEQNDQYWARHFVILEADTYKLVVLNSSAFHGEGQEEQKHGRISKYTLDALLRALEKGPTRPINILLCHHHPQQHSELNLGDYDVMKDGQLLLELLGNGQFGEWLVIHGHKHHPKICYAAGGNSAPTVFSAGSLCAHLYLELQSVTRNQFYVFHLKYNEADDLGLVGTFRAWDWSSGLGWRSAGMGSGLPAAGGFGWRGKTLQMSKAIAGLVTKSFISWDELKGNIPAVDYLLPSSFNLLAEELENKYGVVISYDDKGLPSQVAGPTE